MLRTVSDASSDPASAPTGPASRRGSPLYSGPCRPGPRPHALSGPRLADCGPADRLALVLGRSRRRRFLVLGALVVAAAVRAPADAATVRASSSGAADHPRSGRARATSGAPRSRPSSSRRSPPSTPTCELQPGARRRRGTCPRWRPPDRLPPAARPRRSPTARRYGARTSSAAGCGSSTRRAPSPLVTLMLDVAGRHRLPRPARRDPSSRRPPRRRRRGDVTVDLVRPAADFLDRRREPDVRRRPAGRRTDPAACARRRGFVGSGGYASAAAERPSSTLTANAALLGRHAGDRRRSTSSPTLGGREPGRGLRGRRPRLRADRRLRRVAGSPTTATLGPQLRDGAVAVDRVLRLRREPAAVRRRPRPPGVRHGRRLAPHRRASGPTADPRPSRRRWSRPGIPGRQRPDFLPAARPGRRAGAPRRRPATRAAPGFPDVTMLTGGTGVDAAILAELKRELGHHAPYETMELRRLLRPPGRRTRRRSGRWAGSPTIPGRNDFLGVLLGTGSSNNYGHWTLARVRRGHRRRRRRDRPGAAVGRLRPGRDDRPARRAGRPAGLRHRLGAVPRPGCSAPARTAWASCAWRAWRGPSDRDAAVARPRPRLARRSRSPGRRAAARSRPRPTPTFGTPTVDARPSARSIDVHAAGRPRAASIARAELLVTFADALGPRSSRSRRRRAGAGDPDATPATADRRPHPPEHAVSAPLAADAGGDGATPVDGPAVDGRYADDRFDWKTATGDIVRVHWYEGGDAFGAARPRRSARTASPTRQQLLGVTETEPVDFFIYADQDAFYDALGPGTRENVGGQANADIRTLFALITPRPDRRRLGRHGRAPRAHPPRVRHGGRQPVPLPAALAQRGPGRLPEPGLRRRATGRGRGRRPRRRRSSRSTASIGQFPTTRRSFCLAYAESVSAVDYLVRTYGQDALVALSARTPTGVTDDEAFTAALGRGHGRVQ